MIAKKLLVILELVKIKSEEVGKAVTDITKVVTNKVDEVGEAITDAKDFVAQGSVIHWVAYLLGLRTERKTSKRSRPQDKE